MFLLNATGLEIMNSIRDFFSFVFSEFAGLWYWPIIVIGLMVLAFIVMLILIGSSYENRILKSVNKINTYFLSKPFITEENLVEFNLKMKKVPKVLRNNWQIYMLNREDSPTTYINSQTCIDKPLRTSSIEKNMSNFSVFTILLTFIAFIVGTQYSISSTSVSGLGSVLFYSALVPLGVVFLYTVFILIMKLMKNDIYSMLYDNFPLFERNLTKAVSTLPSYVDYEVLFTKKEIKEGIPILQQYLEKRALVEQQELEKARENSVASEEYNFDELGINGALVLERAMKECETFIKTRRRLQEECDEIETEKENYRKNFEVTEKDFQRKLQASRENLESLKSQQEASTNRIESNYIKKQQSDEIKKQQQLEKDSEEATAKFNEEQVTLEQEIEKRKQEIEEKRSFVEQAMLLEFKHYANTLYKALSVKAAEIGNQKVMNLAQENADLKGILNDLQGIQGPQPNVQDNLVKPEEVASENLYEMTKNDEQELEDGRKESKENAKVEDSKEQERIEEAKKQQENTNNNLQDSNGNASDDNSTINASETEINSENNSDNNNSGANGDDADGNFDGVGTNTNDVGGDANGVDSTGDGGQEMANEENNSTNQEEDIEELQKKIEEENANLQKQKEELAKDLDKTISRMDMPEENTVANDVQNNVEESTSNNQEQSVEMPQVNEQVENKSEKVIEESVANKEEPVVEEAPVQKNKVENLASEEESPDTNVSNRANERQRRTPLRSSRLRGANSSARKVNSEIDALNAEMEKLLDSTKK